MSVRNQIIRTCISFYDACFLCSFLVDEYITVMFNYLANVSQPTPVLYEYLPSKNLKRKRLCLTWSIPVMNRSVSMGLISLSLLFYWWMQLFWNTDLFYYVNAFLWYFYVLYAWYHHWSVQLFLILQMHKYLCILLVIGIFSKCWQLLFIRQR